MAHLRNWTSFCRTLHSCLKHSVICSYFTANTATMILQLMFWHKIHNLHTRCLIKKISNLLMPSFSKKHHQNNRWESSIWLQIDILILWGSSLRAFKMQDWQRITKVSKNHWSSLTNVWKSIFLSSCLKLKFIGTKKITQLLKNYLGKVLNFVLIMKLGN